MALNVLLDLVSALGLVSIVAMLVILVGHRHVRLPHFAWLAVGFGFLGFNSIFDLSVALGWTVPDPAWLVWVDVSKLIAIFAFVIAVFGMRAHALSKERTRK